MKITDYWYRDKLHPYLLMLYPFSLLFRLLIGLRYFLYRSGIKRVVHLSVPIIVVGNLTVGGTGKTPFVLWLVEFLKKQGKNPGIALRGTGSKKITLPTRVTAVSNPYEVGDEAVLLAQRSACPVVACVNRVAAARELLASGCDLIVCDDGLQHYALGRDLEIAIIDGQRYFGNGHLLPTGPLREPLSRLSRVDFIMINHHHEPALADSVHRIHRLTTFPLHLEMENFIAVSASQDPATVDTLPLSAFAQQKVHAIAGIGNPQPFFDMLKSLEMDIIPHVFPDHYAYQVEDLAFADKLPVIMTEKDAIKCQYLGLMKSLWYLRIKMNVSELFEKKLLTKLKIIS